MNARRVKLAFVSGLIGLLGCVFSYAGMIVLGIVTGVVASCSWAPDWWTASYPFVFVAGVPLGGAYSARWYWKRSSRSA